MDGQIRYQMVVRLQAEARRRAADERTARMANGERRERRTLRSAVRVALRLPIPA